MNERLLSIALTLVSVLGLLGLGYELGTDKYAQQLESCRRLANQQTERANKLAALNQQLEQRVAQLQYSSLRPPVSEPAPVELANDKRTLILHRGRAVIIEGGELILALENLTTNPKRVAIKVKNLAGVSQTVVLGTGSSVVIKLDDRTVTLVVKDIHASSATVRLIGI